MAQILDQAGQPITDMAGSSILDMESPLPPVVYNTSIHHVFSTPPMELVFRGRDNIFLKELRRNEARLNMTQMESITKVAIIYKGALYNSVSHPESFNWSSWAHIGAIGFYLGKIPTLPTGRDKKTRLIIYTANHTRGIVWGTLDIKVMPGV